MNGPSGLGKTVPHPWSGQPSRRPSSIGGKTDAPVVDGRCPNDKPIDASQLLASLPDEWPVDLLPEIQTQVKAGDRTLVVLDDDPTGTQTVHDVPVLTEWSTEALRDELKSGCPLLYVLTNSRSLPLSEARSVNREIGRHLVEAARQAGRRYAVVSRSDSTLRGHFPGEVEALAEALGQGFHAWLLIPFFQEGGRYTIHDVHYVADCERLVPAGETEFARDETFGYRASNLRQWVEEKTEGRIPAETVASISLEDIRCGGPRCVTERLLELADGTVCIVNAASNRDLEVFTCGLLAAEACGRRFLYRSAASFVPVRAGTAPRALLSPADLNIPESGGGLIVAGSYVPRTTEQLRALLRETKVIGVEVRVKNLLSEADRPDEVERAAEEASRALGHGRDVVVFTSRELISGGRAEESLAIGRQVSESLVSIVLAISTVPRYILAKGGITASDLATGGLGARRAMVLGQIQPGVPVWQLGPESRYPGLAYIVFPGNVGDRRALVDVVTAVRLGVWGDST
jgi:uncharacterized protein YgbK (DUF1537 family)